MAPLDNHREPHYSVQSVAREQAYLRNCEIQLVWNANNKRKRLKKKKKAGAARLLPRGSDESTKRAAFSSKKDTSLITLSIYPAQTIRIINYFSPLLNMNVVFTFS